MYLAYNEGKLLVVAERFIRSLKVKSIKKTARSSRSYVHYLGKLGYEYNNTYHRSIVTKLIDADYSALTEEIKTNPKAPKFKVDD